MSIDPQLVARINELARKKKTVGLTDEELQEQQQLRAQYLKMFRQGFEQQLTSVKVVNAQGEDITPQKIKDLRKRS